MKNANASIGNLFATAAIAAGLLLGFQPRVQAQATVIKGEVTATGEFPFFTMPDDPFVDLFVEGIYDVVIVSDNSGGSHILGKALKEVLNATVVGTTYDYEYVSLEIRTPNNTNAKGHYAGSIQQTVSLIRIDRTTHLPIAVVNGDGIGHMTIDSDGNPVVIVEKMQWTVTPL